MVGKAGLFDLPPASDRLSRVVGGPTNQISACAMPVSPPPSLRHPSNPQNAPGHRAFTVLQPVPIFGSPTTTARDPAQLAFPRHSPLALIATYG
ncbi:hypothetical protein BKA66DRAFT_320765 [Pyrenochaeta sp. MPI-SDFR-AT-0127]|nr:hypothetical protein BKA66DRAFT_320765 [Pyrenochaeta sp. MPI-SDFR-AT-0127]